MMKMINKNKEQGRKVYLKKLSQELIKLWFVFSGMFIIFTSAGFAGYSYLHYVQGVILMSSPIVLLQSYVFAAGIAFILTLLYNGFYNAFVKQLEKGEF